MNCRDVESVVGPYLDDELVDAERLTVEHHLGTCDACRRHFEAQRHNLSLIRAAAREAQPPAPESLRNRLHTALHHEQALVTRRRWATASAAAAGLAVVSLLSVQQWRSYERKLFDDDAVLRHARHFPLEIRQPSPQALETWFQGKLDHRVSVPQLPNATATGARILNVRERQAAYIRYDVPRRNGNQGGQVGLFVIGDKPHDVDVGPLPDAEVANSNGYNVVSWRDGDIVYQLVGDLDEADIRSLLPDQPAPATPPQQPAVDVRPVSLER